MSLGKFEYEVLVVSIFIFCLFIFYFNYWFFCHLTANAVVASAQKSYYCFLLKLHLKLIFLIIVCYELTLGSISEEHDIFIGSCTWIRLEKVLCLGVTAGAYILTLFAVSSWELAALSVILKFRFCYRIHEFHHLADEISRAGAWANPCFPYLQSTLVDRMALQQGTGQHNLNQRHLSWENLYGA